MNVGHYIIQSLKEYMLQGSPTLMFPLLMTSHAGVHMLNGMEIIGYRRKNPFTHRVRGEGSVVKSKKRKMEMVISEGSSSQATRA